jgi:hypothetical protein
MSSGRERGSSEAGVEGSEAVWYGMGPGERE